MFVFQSLNIFSVPLLGSEWLTACVPCSGVYLPTPLTPVLGANELGYSSIFSLPVSLLASTVFSESLWQKVWSGKDRKSIVIGGEFKGPPIGV